MRIGPAQGRARRPRREPVRQSACAFRTEAIRIGSIPWRVVRRQPLGCPSRSASAHSAMRVDLNIALLRQPGGFQGIRVPGVEAEFRDFASGELVEEPVVLVYTDAAASPLCYLADPNEDPLLTKIGELLGKQLPLNEILRPVGSGIAESRLAVEGRSVRISAVGDDVITEEVGHRVGSPSPEGLEAAAHNLNVLLRHRLKRGL